MVTRFNPHQDPNQLSLSALSQGLILNRNKGLLDKVMKRVTHQLNVRRVKNIAQFRRVELWRCASATR